MRSDARIADAIDRTAAAAPPLPADATHMLHRLGYFAARDAATATASVPDGGTLCSLGADAIGAACSVGHPERPPHPPATEPSETTPRGL